MCRPPDIVPGEQPSSTYGAGSYDYIAAAKAAQRSRFPAYAGAYFNEADVSPVGAALVAGSIGGGPLKRSLADAGLGAETDMRKAPRSFVSSDFDNAASSFIARMEQSVMEDHLKLQHQKRQQHLLNQFLMSQAEAEDAKAVNLAAANRLASVWPMPEEAAFGVAMKKPAAPTASLLLPRSHVLATDASLGVSTGLPVGAFPPHMLQVPVGSVMGAEIETDEKKSKRILSNRASAKRSRQRRQERLEELEKESAELLADRAAALEKLDRANDELARLRAENSRLAKEVNTLKSGQDPADVEVVEAKPVKEEQSESVADGSGCFSGTPTESAPALAKKVDAEPECVGSEVTEWSLEKAVDGSVELPAGAEYSELGDIMGDDLFAGLLDCFDAVA